MTQALVIGLIQGLTIGLLAVGLVLVYKANRFINLGHTQLGTLSAALLGKFVLDWGLSWWLAFPVAVGGGVLTGMVVERWVVRPLRRRQASTEMLLLASIGLSQVLLALVFIPAFRPSESQIQTEGYPLPFEASFEVGGIILNTDALLILAAVPFLVALLAAFLQFTLLGKMIRGAASNPEAARLCGISINRVSAVTWGIAGALSAITAVFLAPSQGSFDAAELGPELLLLALGAAAVGGFVSVPAACVGGIGLGLIDQVTQYITADAADGTLAVFVAIIVIFFVRGRAISAAAFDESEGSIRPPLRVPDVMRDHPLVRRQRLLLAIPALAVALVLPLLPFFSADNRQFELVLILVYSLVGVALTLVVGWAGQVSLGHFALVGVGAFVAARMSEHQWSLPIVFLVAGVVGAAVLAVAGIPALRLRGLTMAVTTLGLAVVAPTWLFRQDWFGSELPFGLGVSPIRIASGMGGPFDYLELYYTAVVVLALVLLASSAIRRSTPGRLVFAVRDNEAAASSFGITPATVKLGILAVSGFVAASSGVLWAEAWRNVSNQQFTPAVSISLLAVPVIGGLGSLPGAVLGALFVYVPTFFITPLIPSWVFGDFGRELGFQLALGGISLLVVVLRFPNGVAGAAQRGYERFLAWYASRLQDATEEQPAQPPLVVEGVSMSFGGLRALREASIRVDEGEIVGLIGANGAGKTTLLNTVSGTLQPDEGSILVHGHEVADLPPEYRAPYGLARSFQHARLFPGLTVLETIQVALSRANRVGFVSSALGAPWVRSVERSTAKEALEMIERLGLTEYTHSLTSELSTGTRRICDLATQLAARPSLLLLDEPTAGVAQREGERFPLLLRRIRDEMGASILIVEHDMPLLMGLCDRVYAMETGQVIAEGTPQQVRDDPAVVASYLGTDDAAINRSGSKGMGARANGARRRSRGEPLRAGDSR